jgi:hypothetical protein
MRPQLFTQLFLLAFSSPFFSQNTLVPTYHPPLDIPLILSANFGELRPNHFHMGLDFKTQGKEGLKLYSIESGYVARIKVSPYGYGKVIYINHPNGITSVYAHCSAFLNKIDSLVNKRQEIEQNYEVEILLKPDEIVLQKGEVFALSGNTGSSTAPHLHFELRDTKTENALNPLKNGFTILDHLAPEIKNIKIYGLTAQGYLLPGKSKTVAVQKGKYGYYIGGDATTIPSDFCSQHGGIGVAFEVVDHYDQAPNPIGLYGSYLIVNRDTLFGQKIDEVSFENSRYINSHTDYQEYNLHKKKYHKSFRTKDNPLTIYTGDNLGIIPMQPKDTAKITYVAFDANSNKSQISFKINALSGEPYKESTSSRTDMLFPDSAFHFECENYQLEVPEGCVYEPIPKYLENGKNLSLGRSTSPIQKPIQIKLKLVSPALPPEKYYVAANNGYVGTRYENGWLIANSKFLGTFTLKTDTLPPTIAPLNFLKTDSIIKKNLMTWKVTESKTSLVDYDLYIDGKWFLLAFESKGSYVYFKRPADLQGTHTLLLKAKDACGNESTWEKEVRFD